MSAPEEIVCETEEAYRDACARYGSFIGNFPPRHGDVSSGFKTVPVRIVYRPPPPRDEAREAFRDWLRTALRGWQGGSQFGVMDMETAFVAGRASVKP